MLIPTRNLGGFARELISACSASREERIMRGAVYKSMYLTGDENGNTATLNKVYQYINTLSGYLYSPVDVRYAIRKYGMSSRVDRAKASAAAAIMQQNLRDTEIDTDIEEAVDWALVKGKTFIKMLHKRGGLEPMLVQPEYMGVLEEDKKNLDKQEAFFHRIYITPNTLWRLVQHRKDARKMMKKAEKYFLSVPNADGPGQDNVLRQVILGGLYPYQAAGASNSPPQKGIVNWLDGPVPQFDPKTKATLMALDELWIWDDQRDDYATIQIIGDDLILFGDIMNSNAFAESTLNDWTERTKGTPNPVDNPLAGHHPFVEFCPNPINGYFWGLSEIMQVALLQSAITARLNGINKILRLQENPPRAFFGATSINQRAYSVLNKPGGYFSDQAQGGKVQTLAPELPGNLFESLHELITWMDEIGGFPAIMRGKGESGVRSQAHAQTLVSNVGPQFKRKALRVERSAEAIGGITLSIMKVMDGELHTAWVPLPEAGVEGTGIEPADLLDIPPAKGLGKVKFLIAQLPPGLKVTIDGHSSSPAFAADAQEKLVTAAKLGAIGPDYVVDHIGLPDADDAEADLVQRKAEAAAAAAAQLAAGAKPSGAGGHGGKKH